MTEDRMKEVLENTRKNLELDWQHLCASQTLTTQVHDLVLALQVMHGVKPEIVSGILEILQLQKDEVRTAIGQILLLRKALSEVE